MQSPGQLKRWMAGVAAAGLVTGLAIGVAVPRVYAAVFPGPGDDPEVLRRMQARYGLDRDQTRLIRSVLRDKDARIMAFVVTGGHLPPDIERSVQDISRQADDRIYAVLDSKQREQYTNDQQSQPSAAGHQPGTKKK